MTMIAAKRLLRVLLPAACALLIAGLASSSQDKNTGKKPLGKTAVSDEKEIEWMNIIGGPSL